MKGTTGKMLLAALLAASITVSSGTVFAAGATETTAQTGTTQTETQKKLAKFTMTSKPDKLSYFVGETLDLTGMTLEATYSDGTKEAVTEGYTCDTSALDSAGSIVVTIKFGKMQALFSVVVKEIRIIDVKVTVDEDKKVFYENGKLNLDGVTVMAIYNDGTQKNVTDEIEYKVEMLYLLECMRVTVSYGGKTADMIVPFSAFMDMLELKEDAPYTVEDGELNGVPEKMTIQDLLKEFENTNLVLKDKDGNVITDENVLVGTGMTISTISLTTGETTTITVVVSGDTDGDGAVSTTDFLQIKSNFLRMFELAGAFLEAADVDGDGVITATDFLCIKRHFLKTGNLYNQK